MSFVWLSLFQLCLKYQDHCLCVCWHLDLAFDWLRGRHYQGFTDFDSKWSCKSAPHGFTVPGLCQFDIPLCTVHIQPWFILLLTILLLHPHCFRGKNDKMMQLELMVKEQKKVIETQKDIIEDNKAVIEQFHKWRSILPYLLPWWCYTVYITPNCPYLVTDLDDW